MTDTENNKNSNSPVLRFPGFTEPWKKCRLGDYIRIFSGESPNCVSSKFGIIPYYKVEQLNWCEKYLGETPYLSQRGKNILPEGCVVFSKRGAAILTNKVRMNLFPINIDTNLMGIKADNSFISDQYLFYFILRARLSRIADTSTIPQINNIHINPITIHVPSLEEQEKITRSLGLLDERIATQRRLIDKLETLIKGIAELLTTNTPNTKITDCLVCHSSTLQENQAKSSGKYRVYGASGICGYTDLPDVTVDSILIVKDGSGVGTVAYASGKYSVIGTSNYLTAKNRNLLKYIYYCLKFFNFTPYKTGMAIPHIYFKDYGKAKIYCPAIEEQRKIAAALSNIERKIEIERTILQQYTIQKQYLLQQMFI